MLPQFLSVKKQKIKLTSNRFYRFHRLIDFILILLKYLNAEFYSESKISKLKTTELDTFVIENLTKPSEGIYLKCIQMICNGENLALPQHKACLFKKLESNTIKKLDDVIELITDLKIVSSEPRNILGFFKRVVTMKNRFISHGSTNEETATRLVEALEPLLNQVIDHLSPIFSTPLVKIMEGFDDNNNEIVCIHGNLSELISTEKVKNNESGLYFIIEDQLATVWPLLTIRDGKLLLYNRFDPGTQKVFFTGEKDVYIRTSHTDIGSLFGIDVGLAFSKPLDVRVQVSDSGICHNLPPRDYQNFIGREKEIEKLLKLLTHKRHFITALDGIGGVGKSSVTL